MNEFLIKNLKGKAQYLFLLTFCLLSSSAVCHAAPTDCSTLANTDPQKPICQLKNNTIVTVSTSDVPDWYDSDGTGPAPASLPLHNFAVCDPSHSGPDTYSDYTSINPVFCNDETPGPKHTKHEEYYSSDSLDDDNNINTADENFTISATSGDLYGVKEIRIEWFNDGVNPPASETAFSGSLNHIECTMANGTLNDNTCSVCREGGNCDYPVIPVSMLSTLSGGGQNVLWFRIVVTDGNDNILAMGYDEKTDMTPVLDKYYRFPICGLGCKASCDGNDMPQVASMNQTCAGNSPEQFSWTVNAGETQSAYTLDIQEDSGTSPNLNPIHSYDGGSGMNFTASPGILSNGDLKPGTNYRWRLRVKDSYATASCEKWSDWSSWQSFTTCGAACANNAPKINPVPIVIPPDFCVDSGLPYKFNWVFDNNGDGDGQAAFTLEIWENGIDPDSQPDQVFRVVGANVQTFTANNLALTKGGVPKNFEWNKTYDWRLKVKDNNPVCPQESVWVSGPSFITPLHQYPTADFDIKDNNGVSCSSSGSKCTFLKDIKFVPTTSPSSTYKWYKYSPIGSTPSDWQTTGTPFSTDQNPVENFQLNEPEKYDITLWISDSVYPTYCCHMTKPLTLAPNQANWNEIPPSAP